MRSAWKSLSSSWRKAEWDRRTVRAVVSRDSESSSGIAPCKRDAAWTCRYGSKSATVPVVAGLFFPRSKALGLDVDYDYSPTALKKVVYAGTQGRVFRKARVL